MRVPDEAGRTLDEAQERSARDRSGVEVSARERGEESEASEQVKRADECSERTSEASGLAKRASDQASTKRAIKRARSERLSETKRAYERSRERKRVPEKRARERAGAYLILARRFRLPSTFASILFTRARPPPPHLPSLMYSHSLTLVSLKGTARRWDATASSSSGHI